MCEESLSFCEIESSQTNNVNNTLFDNNIIEDEQNAMQRDGSQPSDYLQLNGERLLWKGRLEMLKDLMLELQEQVNGFVLEENRGDLKGLTSDSR